MITYQVIVDIVGLKWLNIIPPNYFTSFPKNVYFCLKLHP